MSLFPQDGGPESRAFFTDESRWPYRDPLPSPEKATRKPAVYTFCSPMHTLRAHLKRET